jgi:hypothetical protein
MHTIERERDDLSRLILDVWNFAYKNARYESEKTDRRIDGEGDLKVLIVDSTVRAIGISPSSVFPSCIVLLAVTMRILLRGGLTNVTLTQSRSDFYGFYVIGGTNA